MSLSGQKAGDVAASMIFVVLVSQIQFKLLLLLLLMVSRLLLRLPLLLRWLLLLFLPLLLLFVETNDTSVDGNAAVTDATDVAI